MGIPMPIKVRQANDHLGKLVPILRSERIWNRLWLLESEALSLHAMMLTSQPYFVLMQPNTLEIINRIWVYRRETGVKFVLLWIWGQCARALS